MSPSPPGRFSIYSCPFPTLGEADEVNGKWSQGCPVSKSAGDGQAQAGVGFLSESQRVRERILQNQLQFWIYKESRSKVEPSAQMSCWGDTKDT